MTRQDQAPRTKDQGDRTGLDFRRTVAKQVQGAPLAGPQAGVHLYSFAPDVYMREHPASSNKHQRHLATLNFSKTVAEQVQGAALAGGKGGVPPVFLFCEAEQTAGMRSA